MDVRTKLEHQRSAEAVVTDFPRSLIEFQHRFPDEAACAAYLFAARWPDGFVCPGCGKTKALAAGQPSSCRPTNRSGL
jgi:hypothetical protein